MSGRRKSDQRGTLIIIGGHEDRTSESEILREVVEQVGQGRLIVATVASHEPEGYFEEYQHVFGQLGIEDLAEFYVVERAEAMDVEGLHIFEKVTGVFFTGGDQLRITSQIGDTPAEARIREIYEQGGVIAGTSAGAAAMCDVMLFKGEGEETYRVGSVHTAAGLGFIRNVIIDQHFSERGRMRRLLGAVAQNPRMLGVGIDENTALIVKEEQGKVIGQGSVYIIDAAGMSHSNIATANAGQAISTHDIHLHVLSRGDHFDFATRRPSSSERNQVDLAR